MWWWFAACESAVPECPKYMTWHVAVPVHGGRTTWCEGTTGARNGLFIQYHANGQMSVDGWFWRNQRNGNWKRYRADGTLEEAVDWYKGKRHGTQLVYGSDGRTVVETIGWREGARLSPGETPPAAEPREWTETRTKESKPAL